MSIFTTPGHFYCPLPDIEEIKNSPEKFFNDKKNLLDIDLNTEGQLSLLNNLSLFYNEFLQHTYKNLRYKLNNGWYGLNDAFILYSMIRYLKPKRIIEIGCGFSSSIILDTNELFFNNQIKCTFIEPYPDRLYKIIKEEDKSNIEINVTNLQNIDLQVFSQLEENDILFIDSSHTLKIGSDVSKIFFEILPTLNKNVYIHFHDIFYPFEYPMNWIFEGRAWNEAYVLRAFLQNNNNYKIQYFNNYICQKYFDVLNNKIPLCLLDPGGNFWLKKVK